MTKVSLNPLYWCNFRCSFCYLTEKQLSDTKVIDFDLLNKRLAEIGNITAMDLYGGEVGLLKEHQWYEMKNVIRKHYSGVINVITNLSRIHPGFLDDDVDLSVSYDFTARQASSSVRNNMLMLDKDFSILMLAGKELITFDVDNMINELNLFSRLKAVEIKPYSTNQANVDDVSFSDFEEFVKKWITSDVSKNFEFVNEFLIEDVIDGVGHSFSDDHIYITPSGKFGVLEFDENDNEYFLELESFDEYKQWTNFEKERVTKNDFCNGCEYFGKCLSEHLRDVKDLTNSCNGFKNLIDWYKNEIID